MQKDLRGKGQEREQGRTGERRVVYSPPVPVKALFDLFSTQDLQAQVKGPDSL